MHSTPLIVTLLCGLSVTPAIGVENLPPTVVAHLNRQGPMISSAIFRSEYPAPQMAVYYCVDENLKGGKNEGANNAANTHCAVALFNRGRGGRWLFGDEAVLGHGAIKDFINGLVSGESVEYGKDDAPCCPSVRNQIHFDTGGGKLVRIAE